MEDKKQATIRLKNLAIGYKAKNNTKVVASGLCTEINSGELTCLLGANGVGKSTFVAYVVCISAEIGRGN